MTECRNERLAMKKSSYGTFAAQRSYTIRVRHIGLGILAGLLVAGCASHQPTASVRSGTPTIAGPIHLELGPVGVISPPTPAEFRFDKAEGHIESAADAAGNAAGRMLVEPTSDD